MTTSSHTRATLLALLQQDHERFITLTGRLNADEQQRPFTPEGWSMKDFLAHMTFWKKKTHALVVAYLHAQPLPPAAPSSDEDNALRHQHDITLSLQQIHDEWEAVHSHLQHLVSDELDERHLAEDIRVPWGDTDTEPIGELIASMYHHDAEHFDLVEQYL